MGDALDGISEPQLIGPLRTPAGYSIIKLHDTRRMIEADIEDTEVALRQIILPVAKDADSERVAARMAQAETLVETITGCSDFLDTAATIEDANAHNLGRLQTTTRPQRHSKHY